MKDEEEEGMITIRKKPLIWGFLGSIVLLLLYFGILTLANSFNHAIDQFIEMWYWISLLVIGFGIQVGLYSYIRTEFHARRIAGATTAVAGAGGVSTGSMIACCAHHLTDILPIIGLSAAAVFLVKYQLLFILIGVLSNFVGILMMLSLIQEHKLYNMRREGGFFKNIFRYNMKKTRNIVAVFSVIILFSVAFMMVKNAPGNVVIPKKETAADTSTTIQVKKDNEIIKLPTKTNEGNGLTFTVTPLNFDFNNENVEFEIRMNTHQGSLDFDLMKISTLEDDEGNEYSALKWDGPPPGGHHLSGILTFPKFRDKTVKSMKLTIRNAYGVPERIFVWDLTI